MSSRNIEEWIRNKAAADYNTVVALRKAYYTDFINSHFPANLLFPIAYLKFSPFIDLKGFKLDITFVSNRIIYRQAFKTFLKDWIIYKQ